MPLSNVPSSGTSTSTGPQYPDTEISSLASALSDVSSGLDPDRELSQDDLVALLAQLERAEGVAMGVESRLDGILDGLDELLGSLGKDGDGAVDERSTTNGGANETHEDASTSDGGTKGE